jgi:hypothetical protein
VVARPGRITTAGGRHLIAAALVALTIAVSVAWGWPFFHDDAFITLRYVDRLLHGKGLTWSSLGPPVEGFTHPLWTLQLAALGAAGLDLEWSARLLGLAYLGALAVLWFANGWWPLPLAALASSPAVALWAGGGLETMSFAFWCTVSAAFVLRAGEPLSPGGAVAWGAALGACALTRPEGVGVALLALGFSAWQPSSRRALAPAALTAAALVAGWQAFRLVYYGDWLPNTVYAKIRAFSAEERLARCVAQLADSPLLWVPALVAVAIALLAAGAGRSRRAVLLAVAVSGPILTSWLLAGGDHMPALRPFVPVLALAALGLATAPRRPAVLAGVSLWVACNVVLLARDAAAVQRDPAAWHGELAGRLLGAHLPSGSVVALATAGSTPYYAPELEFIDTLGLNDRHIARRRDAPVRTRGQRLYPGHEKGDGPYVLSRRPDVIILGPAEGSTGVPPDAWFLTDVELAEDPRFWREYSPYVLLATPPPRWRGVGGRRSRGAVPMVFFLRRSSPRAEGLRAGGRPLLPN